MTTVFAILLIVINLGKGLIVLVNKYAPEEIIVKKQVTPQRQTATSTPAAGITNQTTAAIVSAGGASCRNRIGCKCYDRWKRQNR
ncbi:sodium pump decarboxylase gamma subunit [Parabacteroides merdae CAG:48]|nr:sodium pump decarboxylase gamma subunit [Parabacteroides merdae CAG:48]